MKNNLTLNNLTLKAVCLLSVTLGGLLTMAPAYSRSAVPANRVNLATLANGNYQICSQPKPTDWKQGAGVCLVFAKNGDRIAGYYGYPHSDGLICLRGTVQNNNAIAGQALLLNWAGDRWENLPNKPFHWDTEKRLTLDQGQVDHRVETRVETTEWILFRKATLNVAQFYQYAQPLMTSPKQVCDWNYKQKP